MGQDISHEIEHRNEEAHDRDSTADSHSQGGNDLPSIALEGSSGDDGIIQVTEATTDKEEDEVLRRLKALRPFLPLVKDSSERTSGLESLLGIHLASRLTKDKTKADVLLPAEPLIEIKRELKTHMRRHLGGISHDQRLLLQRIKYVDELSAQTTQALLLALSQARLVTEKANDIKKIGLQAQQLHAMTTDVFGSLKRLEDHLAPEDRPGHPEFASRWPALEQLYQKQKQSSRSDHPAEEGVGEQDGQVDTEPSQVDDGA